MERVALKFVP